MPKARRTLYVALLAAAASFMAVCIVSGEIPKLINYQGRLVDSATGLPLEGSHTLTFRIYDALSEGNVLWSETAGVVADSAGVFAVTLGSIVPVDIAFDVPCWLQVEADGEVLSPRREITSSAYAFHAMNADSVPALGAVGTINAPTNPVDWTKLKDVPAGFADGVDNVGGGGNRYSLDAVDGSPTDVVYVDAEGQVGVGTAEPHAALDVVGNINLTDALKINGVTALRMDSLSTGGIGNTFVGGEAGYANESGTYNTFAGTKSGRSNTSGAGNTFIGAMAGSDNATGSSNTFVGGGAGRGNNSGDFGTFVGGNAGLRNKSGLRNVLIGASAGLGNETGSDNVCVGTSAALNGLSSSFNTIVGAQAGFNCRGDGNVFIGRGAGYSELGSNKLYIANGDDTTDVLIYGNFATRRLGIGKVNPIDALDVAGSVNLTDRLKHNGAVILATESWNTFVGKDVGASNTGDFNTFVGHAAGYSNESGTNNVFVGSSAGGKNVDGIANAFVGAGAGAANTSGGAGTFLGQAAGLSNTSGQFNTSVGYYAGMSNTTGGDNVYVGSTAGSENEAGSENTFLGTAAGYNNTGSGNVFLGYHAGLNESGTNKLYIANREGADHVLIYGDFGSRRLGIGTLTPGEALDVAGSINLTGSLKYNGTPVLTADSYNTCIGESTGASNLPGLDVFVGKGAGQSNVNGFCNVFVGNAAGIHNQGGQLNTFIGSSAGATIVAGDGNCFLGWTTGASMTSGSSNAYFGTAAGFEKQAGYGNTFLGTQAGYNNTTGDGNVFLGYGAGFNEKGSNKLYIANESDTSKVLIYGDFSSGRLGLGTLDPQRKLHIKGDGPRILVESTGGNPEVNLMTPGDGSGDIWAIYKHVTDGDLHFFQGGDKLTFQGGTGCVAIGATDPQGYRLYVQGQAYATGGWQPSDLRLKTDLLDIDDALGKVLRLSGHSFRWRTEDYPDRGFPEGRHYGLVAQEVEQVLPEVVGKGPDGEKALAYSDLIPVLVEAVKQLEAENEVLKQRIEALERATHLTKR